ncbi:putative nuclease HARBI1 [Sphaeramia orbicularis]|uniref:Putative nuclease HARBI1 n=1 Tax=Sphaeramia orbicularis TaxID=375764 RepID=A0A673AUN8_9TELE|nr:putative nuclease HARBI1 [Sphaeramia orbicularis]
MAFALPVWLAVHQELLAHEEVDRGAPTCFDEFDDESLFQLFHLTRPCITFITDTVRARMNKVVMKKPVVSVDSLVMVTLDYYAHGVSSASILDRVGLSQAHSPAIISLVSGTISGMVDQFISFPQTEEARANVAAKIEQICDIPNVLGIIAPAHFRVRASSYEDDYKSFVNTLGNTSVVSQLICDSDGNILSIEKCCVGGTSEQEMWESSFKGQEIEEDLHGPYWVIGGKGYHLSKHVLTPVPEPVSDSEACFNEAHAKIYRVIWTTIGSMKRRFKCLTQLGYAREGGLDKKSNIIKACSVLHNIAKKFSVPPPTGVGQTEPLYPGRQLSVTPGSNDEALKARQALIDSNFYVPPRSHYPSDSSSEEEDD